MLKHQRDYVDVNHANNLVIQVLCGSFKKRFQFSPNH